MKYHFRLKKEKKGYTAFCIELKGCQTQGDTKSELEKNMREALDLYLDEPANSKEMLQVLLTIKIPTLEFVLASN